MNTVQLLQLRHGSISFLTRLARRDLSHDVCLSTNAIHQQLELTIVCSWAAPSWTNGAACLLQLPSQYKACLAPFRPSKTWITVGTIVICLCGTKSIYQPLPSLSKMVGRSKLPISIQKQKRIGPEMWFSRLLRRQEDGFKRTYKNCL